MTEENASEQVRVYPSDYKYLTEVARTRRTIVAQIVHEAIEQLKEAAFMAEGLKIK